MPGLPRSLQPRRLNLDELTSGRAPSNSNDKGGEERDSARSDAKLKVKSWLRKSAGQAEPVSYGEGLSASEPPPVADGMRVLPSLADVAAAGGDVPVLRVLAHQGELERVGKELSGLGFTKLGDRRARRCRSNPRAACERLKRRHSEAARPIRWHEQPRFA